MTGRSSRAASGRVRMLDVAREAGVSAQTVSRVLRLPEKVAEATRQRVLEAIDWNIDDTVFGFIPNTAETAYGIFVCLVGLIYRSPPDLRTQ